MVRSPFDHQRSLPIRLRRQAWLTSDPALAALLDELCGYPSAEGSGELDGFGDVAVPLRLDSPLGELRFFSTTTVFGTPRDVTLDELAIEAFFPADEATLERLSGR